MLRGRSKDRKPPPGLYMSNDEFADYLKDLRSNRVARPTGARPQPVANRRDSTRVIPSPSQHVDTPEERRPSSEFPRSASVQSHRRAQSALSTYSSVTSRTGRQLARPPKPQLESARTLKASDVVPTATYMERGQRWMEKEEAVSLRDAMEDMDLKKQEEEEARIHAAAQNEASELVYQHQNPEAAFQPGTPYSYRSHLRKNSYQHARSVSIGRYSGTGIASGMARDIGSRSVSGGSNSSGRSNYQRGRVSSESSNSSQAGRTLSPGPAVRSSYESARDPDSRDVGKSYGKISSTARPRASSRRRSAKRNISGELGGSFTGDQIWEEPEHDHCRVGSLENTEDTPAPLRLRPRNPLNRVQFVQDTVSRSQSSPPETTKRLSRSEIHRNPPSQTRNPNYTANSVPIRETAANPDPEQGPQVPTKDGLEIRSDELRQATSMRLKDRSAKLPTPTVVSDRPGRPIVSFDNDWKPKQADEKSGIRRSPFDRYSASSQRQSLPSRQDSKDVASPIATIHISDTPTHKLKDLSDGPPGVDIPTITAPSLTFPDSEPSLPCINIVEAPTISVSPPGTSNNATRPLPDPTSTKKPYQKRVPASLPRGHWSPVGKRATATCHQCQLPIEGRVVKLHGYSEHFHPACFICFSCGTGLESLEIRPEPDTSRKERLDRIKRRAQGEQVPEITGQTYAEDGDERLRYFCHLDWHENFAPRCKHCKTPIMEEHMIALGEHWHYGHFFCAECGDPFDKGVSHIEKDGYAWCVRCQTKRTERRAPKCKKCRLPVIGEYVEALGGEWHDKCFRCASCHGGFDDGSFFPKGVGNETLVLCTKCIEKELKA